MIVEPKFKALAKSEIEGDYRIETVGNKYSAGVHYNVLKKSTLEKVAIFFDNSELTKFLGSKK